MKRTSIFALVMLAVVSLLLIAAKCPPGASIKPTEEFFATESCVVTDPGEEINTTGWTFYKGQKWECKWVTTNEVVAGTFTLEVSSPKEKHNGQEHTAVAKFTLMSKTHKWVGSRWGTVDKDGSITWINGSLFTPEAGGYCHHIGWLRFDGASVYGWIETRGTN